MIPPHSCSVPGQEARDVDEGDERDVERVARADEARRLDGRVDVEHAGERGRLVADDPDGVAAEPREAADDVRRPVRLHLEELAVVDDLRDHLLHVVRLRRLVRDERVELRRLAVDRIGGSGVRRALEVVLRQEREQVARVLEARLLVGRGEVRDAGLRRVRRRAAELLERDLLAGDRLHDVGAGDEHVRRALRHQHEVGDRGRVDGAAGARAEHERELRHDARGLDVAPEDLRVAGERDDALLDPRAAGVVDPDHRAAVLDGHVHHLADLLGEDLGERAAEDGEVLGEDEDLAAEDLAVAGDDRVAVRPVRHRVEVGIPVPDVAVELDERARVEQLLDPLAREQLPALPLPRDRLLVARVRGLLGELLEPGELGGGRVVRLGHGRGA